MKRICTGLPALVAVAAIALVGCGGGSSSDDAEASPTAPGVDLRTEILEISDLPTGWSVDNSDDDDDSFSCMDPIDDLDGTATAAEDAKFTQGSTQFLLEGIAYFDQSRVADSSFDSITDTFAKCTKIDEDGFTGTVGETSFKQYGDRSKAFTIALEKDSFNFEFIFLFVQQGNRFALVAMGDLGSVDVDALEQIAETAVGKLKSAKGAAATSLAPRSSAPSGPTALPAGSRFTFDNGVAVEVGVPRRADFTNGTAESGVVFPIRFINGSSEVQSAYNPQYRLTADDVPAEMVYSSGDGFSSPPSNSVLPGGEIAFELAFDAPGGQMLFEVSAFGEDSAFFSATL